MSTYIASPLESTVEKHIDTTTKLVRRVDIALSLLIVITLLLAGLFLAILADHWLLKEGLSIPLRLGIFAALAAIAGFYVYRKIVPLFLYPINPVYAADLIEKDVHTFKNSLINWLLLRQEREEREDLPKEKIHARMFDGIVKTAAANVQTVPAGHAVDVRKLIWVGTFFAVLLSVFIAYAALSPKNPFTSLWRLLIPVAPIEAPQAAQFRNVNPGDAVVLQGETLTISAEVVSRSAEPVYLVFSTDDGQAVNQRIPMTLPEGRIAFETQFPPGRQGIERGFNSSVDYWIAQGESRSKQYRIEVQPAASVEIVSLRYDFPAYTGRQPETIEHGGDIKALEGTAVTVTVRSTLPLEKIDLVFDDNPTRNVAMRIADNDKTEARGTFTLKNPFPHQTFSFQATDANGNASRRSGIYRIEVIPDQPPKVQWADTAQHLKEDRISLPLNETLQFPIQAEDPDFALRYLRFKSESPGKRIPDVSFLESPASGPTEHRGAITKSYLFSPVTKRLAVGDIVEVWAEAVDTKLPEANVSSTRKITINVVAPTPRDEEPNQEQTPDENGDGQPEPDKENAQDIGNKQPEEERKGEGGEGNGENGGGQDPAGQAPDENNGEDENTSPDNPNGRQQEGNDPDNQQQESDGSNGGQNQGGNGASGDGPQEGSEPNNGGAGNEPSEGGGNGGTQEGSPENGQPSDERSTQSPDGTQRGEGGADGERSGGGQEQRTPVNPDTQDGDAMERIGEQMLEEGLFDENPFQQGNNPRQRDDSLDPDSPNRSNQGNDPSNPQQASRQQGENPQNQSGEQSGEQPNGGQSPESGQGGNESPESGGQESAPSQGGEGAQESRGSPSDSGGTPQPGELSGGEPGEGAANPQQNGQQGDNPGGPQSGEGTRPSSASAGELNTVPDDPNLAHANQVTNMVLEYLKDQLQEEPSEDLLKKLGWSKEQLQQFYDRWNKMYQDSQQPQVEEGKNLLEEAWKSIGLLPSPARSGLRGSQLESRGNRPVTEANRGGQPDSLRDRLRGYFEGIGR